MTIFPPSAQAKASEASIITPSAADVSSSTEQKQVTTYGIFPSLSDSNLVPIGLTSLPLEAPEQLASMDGGTRFPAQRELPPSASNYGQKAPVIVGSEK